MPEGSSREPGPWELMRGLERVERAVSELGGKVVSSEVYKRDRESDERRFVEIESDVKAINTTNAAKETAERQRADEQERIKKGNQFAILMAIAGPIISAVITFILTRGGAP